MPDNYRWHDLAKNPADLPDLGERVLVTIGESMVGEAYMKNDHKWYRYCDLGPVDQYMHAKVEAWRKMPEPFKPNKGGTKQE